MESEADQIKQDISKSEVKQKSDDEHKKIPEWMYRSLSEIINSKSEKVCESKELKALRIYFSPLNIGKPILTFGIFQFFLVN